MTRTRSTSARSRQRVRKQPARSTAPFAAVLAGAGGSVGEAFAAVHAAVNSATGTMLTQLLLVQGLSLEQAAVEIGMPAVKLRAEGMEFATRLIAALDPDLGALVNCTEAEAAAELKRLAAAIPESVSTPGASH